MKTLNSAKALPGLTYRQDKKLTLKVPRKILEQTTIYFFFSYFSEKIMLDITSESSAYKYSKL